MGWVASDVQVEMGQIGPLRRWSVIVAGLALGRVG